MSWLSRPVRPNGIKVHYAEGAAVGYKWHDARKIAPLFPFGFGLTYTRFEYTNLKARVDGQTVVATFRVRNVGEQAGKDVPQIYLSPVAGGWEAPKRLGAFRKVELAKGASVDVELRIDARRLAVFSESGGGWRIAKGEIQVAARQLGSGHPSRDVGPPQRAPPPRDLSPVAP